MPYKDKESRKEYERAYLKEYRQAKRARGECTRCKLPAVTGKTLCATHIKKAAGYFQDSYNAPNSPYKKRNQSNYRDLRKEVLFHYGGKCVCCGQTEMAFLVVDHTEGDGCIHQTPKGTRYCGAQLYRWLKRNGFPEGFRVLCADCNTAMSIYGQCPHGTLPPQPTNHPANPYRKEWKDKFDKSSPCKKKCV